MLQVRLQLTEKTLIKTLDKYSELGIDNFYLWELTEFVFGMES